MGTVSTRLRRVVNAAPPRPTQDSYATQDATDSRRRLGAIVVGAGALLLLFPVALYFWFVHRYGVNAIYYDQWENIALLTHNSYFQNSYSGHTTLPMLWQQHGENRNLFPNLVVLALGRLTHFNIVVELYLSAVLLVGSLSLIILAHRQDVARTPLLYYLPVAFLVLTLGQFENTLFGFQFWLYLVVLTLAATIFLLDRPNLSWFIFVAAVITAIIGSYSAIDGLILWPVGLVVLFWKRRPRVFLWTWALSAIATITLYFYGYNYSKASTGGGTYSYALSHFASAAEFFFVAIGDLMGVPLAHASHTTVAALVAMGVAIFLLAVACLVLFARPSHRSRSPVGPALICFGLLLAGTVTFGRVNLGIQAATQSRYVTEDLLILAGCYLCLLERWPVRAHDPVTSGVPPALSAARPAAQSDGKRPDQWREGLLVGLRIVALVLIVAEVVVGIQKGVPSGAATRRSYLFANLVSAHAADAPDSLLKSSLVPNGAYRVSNVRTLAEAAKKENLSFFATSEGSRLEGTRLPKRHYTLPSTAVARPSYGTIMRGQEFLVARVSSDYPIKSVKFRISNSSGQEVALLRSRQFIYGFIARWLTTSAPNGTYFVQSTLQDVAGHTSTSHAVSVSVEN